MRCQVLFSGKKISKITPLCCLLNSPSRRMVKVNMQLWGLNAHRRIFAIFKGDIFFVFTSLPANTLLIRVYPIRKEFGLLGKISLSL